MKPRVFLTRSLPAAAMERLAAETELHLPPSASAPDPAALLAGATACQALLCTIADTVDSALIEACPHLKVIANFGVGFNNIAVATASKLRIPVTNTPGVLTAATADLAFGLIIAATRRFAEGESLVRSGAWRGWEPLQLLGGDLAGANLGLIGLGRIGTTVARRAQAFDMRIRYWNRTRLPPGEEISLGLEYRDRDALLAEADVVSLHVAYTTETHHLIDARAFARMKSTAVLVNTARGAVVDEAALVQALRSGQIAAAGLDVYEREPALHPELSSLHNCILLPHLGSATTGTRTRMAMLAIDNLLAACADQRPTHCVNPEIFA